MSRLRFLAIISSSKDWLGLAMAMTGVWSASCGRVWFFLSCPIRRRDPKLTNDDFAGVWMGLGGGFDVLAGAKGSKLRIERKDGMDETGVCGKAKLTEVEAGLGWVVLSEARRNWDTRDV